MEFKNVQLLLEQVNRNRIGILTSKNDIKQLFVKVNNLSEQVDNVSLKIAEHEHYMVRKLNKIEKDMAHVKEDISALELYVELKYVELDEEA